MVLYKWQIVTAGVGIQRLEVCFDVFLDPSESKNSAFGEDEHRAQTIFADGALSDPPRIGDNELCIRMELQGEKTAQVQIATLVHRYEIRS